MRLASLSVISLSLISSFVQASEPQPFKNYQEPSRGFFIEHGMVSDQNKASVELHTGADNLDSGGGIRLGLPNSELIINSGLKSYDGNEALLKWRLPKLKTQDGQVRPFDWALLGGISSLNTENSNDQTNLKLGVSATVKADAGTFTFAPQLVYTNGDLADDTFIEVGIGAYVGVIDTLSGKFSLGAEAIFTSQERIDNQYSLGARWAYNERLNIDVVPITLSNNDVLGLPGLVRLNLSF